MATVSQTDVSREVTRANETFQPADGRCLATPAALRPLLERLYDYTEEVRKEADRHGLGSDTNVAQWARDMSTWEFRLAEYFEALDRVPMSERDTVVGCETIYETVTAPLLDGIYYTQAPGIVLNEEEIARIASGTGHPSGGIPDVTTLGHPPGHSNPKPPDVATPFMLGNQVIVYRDWQAERWRLFWDDLLQGARSLVDPDVWPTWLKVALGVGSAALVGTIGYVVYRKIRPKKAASEGNPKKKRRRKKKNPEASAEPSSPPKLEVVK